MSKEDNEKLLGAALLVLGGIVIAVKAFSKSEIPTGLQDYGDGQLGQWFDMDEFTRSAIAENYGIDEQFDPPESAIQNGMMLAQFILDPIRNFLGGPVHVTSWYRSPELNQWMVDNPHYDAASTSNHLEGGTTDTVYFDPETDNKDLWALINAALVTGVPFDRLLIEGGTLQEPQWVQLEYNPDLPITSQRRQIWRIHPGGTSGYQLSQQELATYL